MRTAEIYANRQYWTTSVLLLLFSAINARLSLDDFDGLNPRFVNGMVAINLPPEFYATVAAMSFVGSILAGVAIFNMWFRCRLQSAWDELGTLSGIPWAIHFLLTVIVFISGWIAAYAELVSVTDRGRIAQIFSLAVFYGGALLFLAYAWMESLSSITRIRWRHAIRVTVKRFRLVLAKRIAVTSTLVGSLIFVIGAMFFINEPTTAARVDIASATLTAGLVLLASTASIYAAKSYRQSIDANMNSVLPVMKAGPVHNESAGTAPWVVHVKNIGKGPAINIEVWVNHMPYLDDPNQSSETGHVVLGALGVDDTAKFTFDTVRDIPPDWTICIQFQDIYQRRFESRLVHVGKTPDSFEFGKLPRLS